MFFMHLDIENLLKITMNVLRGKQKNNKSKSIILFKIEIEICG